MVDSRIKPKLIADIGAFGLASRNPDRPRAREARKLIDAEHTRYVATQKGGCGVSVEPEIVEPLKRLGGSYHGIVGSEHDLASAVAAHALHQL